MSRSPLVHIPDTVNSDRYISVVLRPVNETLRFSRIIHDRMLSVLYRPSYIKKMFDCGPGQHENCFHSKPSKILQNICHEEASIIFTGHGHILADVALVHPDTDSTWPHFSKEPQTVDNFLFSYLEFLIHRIQTAILLGLTHLISTSKARLNLSCNFLRVILKPECPIVEVLLNSTEEIDVISYAHFPAKYAKQMK
ncbi:hypothetical protein LAZ67_7001926 [Cordylochernes scorpioides]|uniref:Uncharacterized protein n=1 Tax=Cordylochernes scorpioides TaxID=51811 RepID=A0ABY6KN79_9ARAC|nr:hypothetical protein LAZ67_7001926 [Cordylochernes scorpioides]